MSDCTQKEVLYQPQRANWLNMRRGNYLMTALALNKAQNRKEVRTGRGVRDVVHYLVRNEQRK